MRLECAVPSAVLLPGAIFGADIALLDFITIERFMHNAIPLILAAHGPGDHCYRLFLPSIS
jgi:hypothetical protein